MIQLDLHRRATRLAVSAVVVLLAGSYAGFSARQVVAEHYSNNFGLASLRRAVWLDPGNAAFSDLLGRQLLVEESPQEALPWLKAAASLNPHSAKYLLDLAVAEQSIGEVAESALALEHARMVDPHAPAVAWNSANLYLAQGQQDHALPLFRTVMENDPPYVDQALATCWKVRPDTDYLIGDIVPPQAYENFLLFLARKGEGQAAVKVWERIFSRQQSVDRRSLFEYLRFLIENRDVSRAALVWQQAAGLSGLQAYQPSSENLLINGDFSLEILEGGFGWLHRSVRGVSLALDPGEGHSSTRSLRITLDGAGINDAGIAQLVPVDPGTNYDLSGFFKAREMDGAGGMELVVNDAYSEKPLLIGEDLRDTDSWRQTGGRFVTGSDTHLIVLRISRVPRGSPIKGRLWIDGLRLVRSSNQALAGGGDMR